VEKAGGFAGYAEVGGPELDRSHRFARCNPAGSAHQGAGGGLLNQDGVVFFFQAQLARDLPVCSVGGGGAGQEGFKGLAASHSALLAGCEPATKNNSCSCHWADRSETLRHSLVRSVAVPEFRKFTPGLYMGPRGADNLFNLQTSNHRKSWFKAEARSWVTLDFSISFSLHYKIVMI